MDFDFVFTDEELDAAILEEDHCKTVAHLWHDQMCTGNPDGTDVLALRWPIGHLGMERMDVIFLDFDTRCHLSLVKNLKRGAFKKLWPELVAFCREHGVQDITLSDSNTHSRDIWGEYGFSGYKGYQVRIYYID